MARYSAGMSIALMSFVAAVAVMLISLSGAIFASGFLRVWMQRNLALLATFAGGVFLIVIYHLLEEALHEGSVTLAAGAVLFGAALIEALHHLLPSGHHHHSIDHDHEHSHIDGRRVLASDAMHNVGDGVLIVAAFSAGPITGIAASIGILIHEFVQEVSEFFVLRSAGYTLRDALVKNLLASATILIGVALALFLSSSEEIAVLFAGVAAGGFLAVILRDLIPNAVETIRAEGGGYRHAIALTLGVVLMFGVQSVFSHQHEHEDEHEDEHELEEMHGEHVEHEHE